VTNRGEWGGRNGEKKTTVCGNDNNNIINNINNINNIDRIRKEKKTWRIAI